jgi:hypothetical protein
MRRRFDLIDSILGGIERGVLLALRDDPSCVRGLCCGQELPAWGPEHTTRLVNEFGRARQHYTSCPVWIADRDLDLAFRARQKQLDSGEYDPDDDPTVPTLADLIYGRASIEEWAELYAGDVPQDWTDEEEREFTGEAAVS